jgi:hypothetical protein
MITPMTMSSGNMKLNLSAMDGDNSPQDGP